MPIRSQAQQRLMFATAGGAKTGVPKATAKKYIAETPKSAYDTLPARGPSSKKKLVLRRKS